MVWKLGFQDHAENRSAVDSTSKKEFDTYLNATPVSKKKTKLQIENGCILPDGGCYECHVIVNIGGQTEKFGLMLADVLNQHFDFEFSNDGTVSYNIQFIGEYGGKHYNETYYGSIHIAEGIKNNYSLEVVSVESSKAQNYL